VVDSSLDAGQGDGSDLPQGLTLPRAGQRTRMKTGLLSFAEYGGKMWGKLQPAAGLRPAYHRFLRVSQAGLKSRAG